MWLLVHIDGDIGNLRWCLAGQSKAWIRGYEICYIFLLHRVTLLWHNMNQTDNCPVKQTLQMSK